jgi:hypothetical protein
MFPQAKEDHITPTGRKGATAVAERFRGRAHLVVAGKNVKPNALSRSA